MLKLYSYAKCSTCRDAAQWLREHKISFVEHPIRETPPTVAELRTMLAAHGGQVRRIFNTSGLEYRAQGLSAKLATMSEAGALALLAGNGMLVKRPFLLGKGVALVGFKADQWEAALCRR